MNLALINNLDNFSSSQDKLNNKSVSKSDLASTTTTKPSNSQSRVLNKEIPNSQRNASSVDIVNSNVIQGNSGSTQSVSVTITSNAGFNASGSYFSGSGTKNDPYLLTGNNYATISISNTNDYFEILNNTISANYIQLTNVTNGLIVNNTISYAYNAITITGNSSNISIVNNTIIGTPTDSNGISITSTFGSITIFNNTIEGFGSVGVLFQDGGSNNVIENNTISNNILNGISIGASSSYSLVGTYNSTIKNNFLTNNYLYFETDYYYASTPIYQFNVTNNFVNNKLVDFFQNDNNPTFSSNPSELVVFNSTNVTITNLPAMSGPFIIARSKNVSIRDITIFNAINPGMDLYSDNNVTLTNNILSNVSQTGIALYSTNVKVVNNSVSGRLVVSYIDGQLYNSYNGIVLGAVAKSANVSFNNITNFNYGISLNSDNATINNNIIKNVTDPIGIGYINSTYSISYNQFYNNSLTLNDYFTKFTFTNNTFDNFPIVIYNGLQDQILSPNGTILSIYGQLYIENSNFIELKDITSIYDATCSNCNNVTVDNIHISINGLTMTSAGNLTIINNTIISSYSMGMHLYSTNPTPNPNIVVENNTIVYKFANLGSQPFLATTGMFLTNLNGTIIKNNLIENFSYGIEVSGDYNTVIFNNTVNFISSSKVGFSGIYVTGPAKYNQVVNNTIIRFSYGVYLDYQITLNDFFNNSLKQNQYAFYVNQGSNNSIYDNSMTGNSYGFYLNYAHYTIIQNNTIKNNYYGGYVYSSSMNDSITGNSFVNSTAYGLYIDSTSSNNIISNNIFLNNSRDGLLIYSVNNTVTLNDFVFNNQSTVLNPNIQVYIISPNNFINGNYYSDSHNYDFNWDGVVDTPYTNFGSSAIDNNPKANPIHLSDTVSPTIFLLPSNNSIFNSNGFLLQYNVSERSVTIIYINSKANYTSLLSGTNMSYLGVGTFNITIKATDLSGNIGITSIIVTIKLSTLNVTILNPGNTTYNSQSINVTYSIVASLNYTLSIYMNGVRNRTSLINDTFWSFPEGYNNLTLYVVDQSGHVVIVSVYFTIDTTPPVLTILSPTNSTYSNSIISIKYTIFDYSSYSTIIYIDGKANTTVINPTTTIKFLTSGYHNITFVITDVFNQATVKSVYFSVNIVKPSITINDPTNSTLTSNTLSLNYQIADSNSYTTEIFVDGVTNTTILQSGSTIKLTNGSHNITIYVIDIDGYSTSKTVFFTIKTVNPTSSSTQGATSQTNTSSSKKTSNNNQTTHVSSIPITMILLGLILMTTIRTIFRKKKIK